MGIASGAPAEKNLEANTSITPEQQDQVCKDAPLEDDIESSSYNQRCFRRSRREPLVIETPFGITLRGKGQLRAAVQTLAFGALLMGYAAFSVYSSTYGGDENNYDEDNYVFLRILEDSNVTTIDQTSSIEKISCDDLKKADSWWLTVFYVIGILYMFLALAIVCDEFFVPALEELSGPRRMNLSMDVAGATLMAAGGSAPELATSLIGTFKQSEIGFGTIVGSAVFNILFVIAMCSILAKEVLTLTWWPLFRDSTYYTFGLVMLAVFTGAYTPNSIELWESCVLFALYIGYIVLMWQNKNLYKLLTGKVLVCPEEDEDACDDARTASNGTGTNEDKDEIKVGGRPGLDRQSSKSSVHSVQSNRSHVSVASQMSHLSLRGGSEHSNASHPHFLWQGTFRAGILKLLKDADSWVDTAGTGIVSKIMGDADFVFDQVDKDSNGHIDKEELRELFDLLECHATPAELDETFKQLDINGDGVISRKEFTEWYVKSEERIMSQVRHVFDQIDVDKSNTLDKEELKTLLATLDPHVSDEDVQSALEQMYKYGSPDEITFDEFQEWYRRSMILARQKQMIEDDIEGVWDNICPPSDGGFRDWIWYIICLPLVLVLTFTIPDVQRPGNGKWCYISFLLSIAWIGGFSFFMVEWAEIVGNTIGIPDELMGLTVLAAGTSVPDLLSSVIVARRGQGDMAVSSSVGSNIFDILVGLPVPWILYSAVNKAQPVLIGSDGLLRSLLILIAMLVLVITAVHCQGWKLTKMLGGIMFLFYIIFLVQAIVLEWPFDICVK